MLKHRVGRRIVGRCAAVALAAVSIGAAVAAPASAQTGPIDGNRRIGVGDQFVREGETVDTAVIAIDGDATVVGTTTEGVFVITGNAVVSGRVEGDVIVINGNARISGRVDQDVVVLDGRAIVTDGAVVRGSVSSSDEPRVERGARVSGDVDQIDVTGIFTAVGFTLLGYLWLAVTASTALLGVLLLALFRRPFEAAATTAATDTGKSIGLGLGIAIGLPVVAIVAITTLIGLPFGLGFLGAQGLLWSLGYVTAALCLGRAIIKAPRSAFGAFFAGWAILRVVALVPGIGALVWVGASVVGIGALVLAALRGARGEPAPARPAPSPTPKATPVPTATPSPAKAPAAKATPAKTTTATKTAAPKTAAPKTPAAKPKPKGKATG